MRHKVLLLLAVGWVLWDTFVTEESGYTIVHAWKVLAAPFTTETSCLERAAREQAQSPTLTMRDLGPDGRVIREAPPVPAQYVCLPAGRTPPGQVAP
jgi:hypothetical protein